MAVSPSRARTADLNHKMQTQIAKKWKDRDQTSPERTKVWTEPKHIPKTERKVSVVYYLSRNGQLEHPHFMEVPLPPSSDGLYLRDVIDRLNFLRGKGMASMYSWSSKRSYKNGFVWHDLGENDFIYPVHGQEYILKGSELIIKDDGPSLTKSYATLTSSSSSSSKKHSESQRFAEVSDFPVISRRRNQSWSSIDLHEYKVYKTNLTGESSSVKAAADASTQTDDKRRRRRLAIKEEEYDHHQDHQDQTTELSREEISPPPSDSSPETPETLMKADGRSILCPGTTSGQIKRDPHPTAGNSLSGRMRASTVLMQLISCGSMSFRDCGSAYVKDQVGREAENQKEVERERLMIEISSGSSSTVNTSNIRVTRGVEDKEYFSGSLIETKKDDIPGLERSSSYNSDRTLRSELAEKEIEGVRAKCIPRKPKAPQAHHTKKESSISNNDPSTSTTKQSTLQQAARELKPALNL